jgi:hypothetical protein
MDTLRLRTIQHPSQVARLLEAYIAFTDILPKGAYQIRTAVAIPTPMRGLVMEAVKLGKSWSCWAQGTQIWLFTAEMSLPLSRERGAPVLQVKLYGEDGLLRESGNMMTDHTGNWCRCAD